jgi:hypothetical protein
MFGSSILEVAIGVIFMYLLFSLVSSALNEYISSLLNKRGEELFEGIKNLLNDPNYTGLAQKLYNHGLVDGISQGSNDPNKRSRRPSYIASKTFALALLDILSSQSAAQSWKDIVERKKTELTAAQARLHATPADLRLQKIFIEARSALEQAQAILTNVDAAQMAHEEAEWAAGRVSGPRDLTNLRAAKEKLEKALTIGRLLAAQLPEPLENIQRAVSSLPDGDTKQALDVIVNRTRQAARLVKEAGTAGSEIEALQENIEQWFNDAMDRVSGWYKRWTQKVLLGIAVIVVLVGNVDTIMLIKRLSQDQVLRASIVSAAEQVAQSSPETLEADVFAVADKLPLPIGWTLDEADAFYGQQIPTCVQGQTLECLAAWALKVVGLLISIIAIQVGAPFWFDTLSKFINIRGAGIPPGESAKSAQQPAKR